jgi:hypothetical protein
MFNKDVVKVGFPWVAFLSQPIGHPIAKLIINPVKFKKLYHIWLLEMCWGYESEVRDYSK